jgi:hypothetical protein
MDGVVRRLLGGRSRLSDRDETLTAGGPSLGWESADQVERSGGIGSGESERTVVAGPPGEAGQLDGRDAADLATSVRTSRAIGGARREGIVLSLGTGVVGFRAERAGGSVAHRAGGGVVSFGLNGPAPGCPWAVEPRDLRGFL